jgi:hypothetical protein
MDRHRLVEVFWPAGTASHGVEQRRAGAAAWQALLFEHVIVCMIHS